MTLLTENDYLAGMIPPRYFAKSLSGTLVAGRPHCYLFGAGRPGAAVAPTPGIGGEVLTSLAGALPFTNPVSGITKLARFGGMATQAGLLLLCDLLWWNSGLDVTLTSEQVFTGAATIPARDRDGAATGNGVAAGVLVSSAVGAGTPTLSLKYKNQAGTSGQIGTNIQATAASAIAGSFYDIGLSAGDGGVQKPESLTLSATWTSGTIHVVLYRILAMLDLQAGIPNAIDAFTGGLPQLFNNSVLFPLFIPNTTTSAAITGHAVWAQG